MVLKVLYPNRCEVEKKSRMDRTVINSRDGNTQGGDKGSTASPQGFVSVRVKYNGMEALRRRKNTQRKTMYPTPSDNTLDILPQEPLFAPKSYDPSFSNVEPLVTSSFNGVAEEIEALYRDDEVQKLTALMNQFRLVGWSVIGVPFANAYDEPFTTCQIGGIVSTVATRKIPTGCHTMVRPPLPSTLQDPNRVVPSGTPPGKVVGELFPYDPMVVATALKRNMNNYLKDESKYKRAMNKMLRSTDAWTTALETTLKFEVNNLIQGLDLLSSLGIIRFDFNPGSPFNLVDNAAASREDMLMALAKGLGLLENDTSAVPNMRPMDEAMRTRWQKLSRDFGRKCHYDGEVANLAFGFDRNAKTIAGKKSSDGTLKLSTPEGAMLFKQLNIHEAFMSSISQLTILMHEWNGPKIVKGGGVKEVVHGLIS